MEIKSIISQRKQELNKGIKKLHDKINHKKYKKLPEALQLEFIHKVS